jgi:hypothetical protein
VQAVTRLACPERLLGIHSPKDQLPAAVLTRASSRALEVIQASLDDYDEESGASWAAPGAVPGGREAGVTVSADRRLDGAFSPHTTGCRCAVN